MIILSRSVKLFPVAFHFLISTFTLTLIEHPTNHWRSSIELEDQRTFFSAMARESYVYLLLRTDYEDREDSEGRMTCISVHGTETSAHAALDEHVKHQIKGLKLTKPNINHSTYEDGLKGTTVIVGQDPYHSFEARVWAEELHDGTVTPKSTAKGAASKASKATKAKPAKVEADDEEDGEEAEDGIAAAEAAGIAPEGSPDCLAGKTFLITGTLEGFTRADAIDLITRYGGEIEKTLKPTVDYVVLGVKAGPKKLEQIKEMDIITINQKGLYDLISSSSTTGSKRAADAPAGKAGKKSKK